MLKNMFKIILFASFLAFFGCETDKESSTTSLSIEAIEKAINDAHVTDVNTWNFYGTQQWSNWFAPNAYAQDGFLIIPQDDGIKSFNLSIAKLVEVDSSIVYLYY